MTPDPRARPLRSLAAAATLALTCALLPASQAGADDLRDRERDAKSGIRGAQEDLQESSRKVNRAQSRLEAARSQLTDARGRLGAAQTQLADARRFDVEMAQRLRVAEAELAQAEAALKQARALVRSQRADIGRLAASMYAHGDPDLMGLSVLLNSQDPAAATSQLNTADALMNRHDGTLARLEAARTEMIEQEARVARAAELVAEEREQAAAVVVEREQLEAEASAAAGAVQSLVEQRRSAQVEAVQIKAADRRALAAAEQQAAEIRELILQRAERQTGGVTDAAGGFLQAPVPGYITSPYGYRVHPIYGYYGLHDGTDFSAPCGTANLASGAGTVISQQYSDVFGNRLYLDLGQVNGKNLTVVYNHLSGYAVSTGQRVSRGQVVGYSGSTGWSTGCHLHFSVLEDGTPVDPMRYL